MTELSHFKVGVAVECAVCGLTKKPIGRDLPVSLHRCTYECPGYENPPYPGSLWEGESEAEFGYPVGDRGIRQT